MCVLPKTIGYTFTVLYSSENAVKSSVSREHEESINYCWALYRQPHPTPPPLLIQTPSPLLIVGPLIEYTIIHPTPLIGGPLCNLNRKLPTRPSIWIYLIPIKGFIKARWKQSSMFLLLNAIVNGSTRLDKIQKRREQCPMAIQDQPPKPYILQQPQGRSSSVFFVGQESKSELN